MGECIENGTSSSDLSAFKIDSLSVISFKMIQKREDFENADIEFKPEMAHQVFGDSELIFGYRSISINIYYLHNSANCYVDIQTGEEIKKTDLYQPDDILKSLKAWLPETVTTDQAEFLKLLDKENHENIFGTEIGEHQSSSEPNISYKFTLNDIKNKEFVEFHKNFESLVVFFIDAANYIDLEDERWMIFYIYEEKTTENEPVIRSPIGFCTVYKFFCYPEKIRARISQIFVLPTHQNRGIGSKFYENIMKYLRGVEEISDITVEEPTPTFQKIRDIVDGLLIYKEMKAAKIDPVLGNRRKIYEGMKKNKMGKNQCQRIFDILTCFKAKSLGLFEYNNALKNIRSRISTGVEKNTQCGKRFGPIANMLAEQTKDREGQIEAEYKRYLEDIKPSVDYLVKHIDC